MQGVLEMSSHMILGQRVILLGGPIEKKRSILAAYAMGRVLNMWQAYFFGMWRKQKTLVLEWDNGGWDME